MQFLISIMGAIIAVLFLTLFNWVLVNCETTIFNTASNIEKSHKTLLADINYQLEFNRVIPGKPDQDYPIHSTVPKTTFSCNGKVEGYYADIESRCQAFRICTNTATSSQGFGFLCPNGTLFSQKLFVCDWYRNVKCNDSELYYNNNNIEVGTEFTIMQTIRLMMEYPIKMLKGDYTRYIEPHTEKNVTNQENYIKIVYDYENPNQNNKSSLLINNLGELSPDFNHIEKNETEPTNAFQRNTISEINLALNINNLAETEAINTTIHKNPDTLNKQPFRFLSQEFSTQKFQNKEALKKKNLSIDINSLYGNDQTKYLNRSNSTIKYAEHFIDKISTERNAENFELDPEDETGLKISNLTEPKYDAIKDNTEYLQNYSSNLLINGIIQTSIEPKIHEHNATVNTKKHFKNFFNKRNLQQKLITTPKVLLTTTTKNPRLHYKSLTNRLHPSISQTLHLKEKSKHEYYPISKKNVRNANTGSNIINHGLELPYQPTWESVQENLMRYQSSNGNISQSSKRYLNRKRTPSYFIATNEEKTILNLDNNTKDSLFTTYEPKRNHTQRNSFNKNDHSIKMANSSNGLLSNIFQIHLEHGNSSVFSENSVIAGAQEQPISSVLEESNNMQLKSSSQKNLNSPTKI
ncbi:hypothetical protein CVS40_8201 [Lucilia cuprina]|nr:hypothetical protein CVS40_8201 [Lucilia cuprina]